ncbi:putative PurR-regulated permease PerM [Methylosinus sp. sav-2]|uniref:AI-2E family transporter n=1 Tax=unclassified Methylosinus TaxID=2624500 RepID=UPI000465CB4C|nr:MULTISPECIES: AI-2E family transporter [unclassified Methylosinus]TDX64255.1 putative PurR-regulated permease PerM [Methylosinus sp. sav-2]
MQNRQIFGLILLAGMIGLGVLVISPFWAPLVWAAILAHATDAAYRRCLRLCGQRRNLAAAVTTILLIVLIVVPVSVLLIDLQSEAVAAYRDISTKYADEPLVLPNAIKRLPVIGPTLNDLVNNPEFRKQQINEWLEPWMRQLAGVVGAVGRSIAQFGVMAIALFFFYRDGDLMLEQIRVGLRRVVGETADQYFRAVETTSNAVVSGLIISAMAQGFIAGVGYAFLSAGPPVLLGVLTALAALIPFVGTVAIWAPLGVWLLLTDQIGAGLGLLAWGALIVNPTDNILKPLLISNAADIPLVVVFLGVMGGLLAFGFVGLFLGPLILAVLLAIWREWLAADAAEAGR